MVLKGIRRQKNRAALEYHLHKITEIGGIRAECDAEGRRGKVLAANFEMASHASRALSAVRHLEELGEVPAEAEAIELRQSLSHVLNLPAISDGALQRASSTEIEEQYRAYRRYNFPHEEAVQESDEPYRLEIPIDDRAPDEVLDSALAAWVQAVGRNFSTEEHLDAAISQVHARWMLLQNTTQRGHPVQQATEEELESIHLQFGETADEDQKKGWVAAMQVVDRLAVAEATSEDEPSYEMLVARAQKDPTSVDYTVLRQTYASTEGFNPYQMSRDALSQAEDALAAGDARRAFEILAPLMELDFLNPDLHGLAGMALDILGRELGRETSSEWHLEFARGLAESILESGSGSGPDDPFVVISLSEEYWVLQQLGVSRIGNPHLVEHHGRKYDVFKIEPVPHDSDEVWFQVDSIYGRVDGLAAAPVDPNSAEYGGVLLAMAKQCAERGDHKTAELLTDRFIEHIRRLEGRGLDSEAVSRFVALAEEAMRVR